MLPIRLIDESRLEAQLQEIVQPALQACRTDFTCQPEPGVTLRCRLHAPPDAQRWVVLLHGFTESADKLEELSYYFLCQGYAVLVYDQRGHGASARAVDDPSLVYVRRFEDYVDDLEQVLRAAQALPGLPSGAPVLFGHSMGGAVAAAALERMPQRFSRGVLNAPMLSIETGGVPQRLAEILVRALAALGLGKRRAFIHAPYTPDERFEESCCTSRARFDVYAALRRERPELRTNAACYSWIAQALHGCREILQPDRLRRVSVPVLVLRAQLDALVRPNGQDAFVRGVPNARLVEIPGVKHEIYRSPNAQLLPYLETIFRFLEE